MSRSHRTKAELAELRRVVLEQLILETTEVDPKGVSLPNVKLSVPGLHLYNKVKIILEWPTRAQFDCALSLLAKELLAQRTGRGWWCATWWSANEEER